MRLLQKQRRRGQPALPGDRSLTRGGAPRGSCHPLLARGHARARAQWQGWFLMTEEKPENTGRSRARTALLLVGGLALAGVGYRMWLSPRSAASDTEQAAKPVARPVPVVAEPARTGDIPVFIDGLGAVTPIATVTVRSRVDGQLMAVHFREGQMVHAGDLLAEIDPRPFQVQLMQAQGQLAKDQALLANAQVDLQRYRKLWAQDSIPKQQLDTQEALVRQYAAALQSDQGQVDAAKLQLTYSRITAPVSGRLGLRLVDPGNMVHATDAGGLVTITQVQPIAVVFAIPEDDLPM